ncbi:xanthomonadin biosynthesis protein [Dyella terrae]|uniref:xanthomonadin biosynthesis protein n=1 Tax=Dyella terrae TaxID=522259 RepID=UPI001EFE9EF5|nr:xanthomonadin biosynthesis protein [Dyella terrae]ULU26314.1 xanthomonadin biosynthesis protein [Dyella terrae]
MSPFSASTPKSTSRRWLPLMFGYPVLAMAGALTHRQSFSLAACALLLTVLMAPALATRRPLPWGVWVVTLAVMGWLGWHGMAGLLLECVPIAINVLLAGLFGCSLRAGSMPLIARIIEALEGPERLAVAGVAVYARHLTWFWALLASAQALVLAVLLLCAEPGGLLSALGIASPWPVPAGLAQSYAHVGGYVLIASAFLLEHFFRRWHLRHIHHPSLRELVLGVATRWPKVLRGDNASSS